MVARIGIGGEAVTGTGDADSSRTAPCVQSGSRNPVAVERALTSALVQVQWAIDDEDVGARILDNLLSARLIACGQILGPMTSRYWWQGSVRRTTEWLVVCKTTSARADDVVRAVAAQHPYDVPEIVVTEILDTVEAYARWVAAETIL